MAQKYIRKHKRKRTIVVLYIARERHSLVAVQAAIADISLGGCSFVTATDTFNLGEKIVLRFTMPNDRIYVFTGEVIRLKDQLHGIQFDKAGLFQKLKLMFLIRKITRTEFLNLTYRFNE